MTTHYKRKVREGERERERKRVININSGNLTCFLLVNTHRLDQNALLYISLKAVNEGEH